MYKSQIPINEKAFNEFKNITKELKGKTKVLSIIPKNIDNNNPLFKYLDNNNLIKKTIKIKDILDKSDLEKLILDLDYVDNLIIDKLLETEIYFYSKDSNKNKWEISSNIGNLIEVNKQLPWIVTSVIASLVKQKTEGINAYGKGIEDALFIFLVPNKNVLKEEIDQLISKLVETYIFIYQPELDFPG